MYHLCINFVLYSNSILNDQQIEKNAALNPSSGLLQIYEGQGSIKEGDEDQTKTGQDNTEISEMDQNIKNFKNSNNSNLIHQDLKVTANSINDSNKSLLNSNLGSLPIPAPIEDFNEDAKQNLIELVSLEQIDIIIKVKGGGLIGQAEAIKLGIARAFCLLDKSNPLNLVRKLLKTKGYLTQDARVKERRKYGLKKARKASQYHKR